MKMKKKGLVLSGGGARGAYQVGVINAIGQICEDLQIENPFQIYTGVSAGAINASFLAASPDNFTQSAQKLRNLWSQITTDQVFYTDPLSLGKVGFKWLEEFSLGSRKGTTPLAALLDTAPLNELLKNNLNFDQIQRNISSGKLDAVGITAMDYQSVAGVTFFEGHGDAKAWSRSRRHGEKAKLGTQHIMASSAIPLLFPPVEVDHRYFGDGCIRNQSPCGPSIYLGAEKIMVIGVRSKSEISVPLPPPNTREKAPGIARVINVLLNAVMLDGIEVDIERLERVNQIADLFKDKDNSIGLRKIDYTWVSPSTDIAAIAQKKANKLPRMVRYMMKTLGSIEEAKEIVSYLLFEPEFCTHLIEIGFEDGMRQKEEIAKFLTED